MLKATRKHLLLLLIFTFSFIYRMLLMLWNNYPSGADIGLHNSVIYSITGSGNTNFLYNFYQNGGGLSLTFPGYHIFASGIMMMTGMPEYWAHAAIVSLFSSLIVLCAFLITRSVWAESAAYIVAFLVAISRFDIEMLLWGGYPNVITLLLIPLTFYLYLQKGRFSPTPFLVSTSILAGSIFLTHSLSAGIYVGVTVVTVLFVLVSPKTFGASRTHVLYWLLPLILGAVLVSPFLVDAVPAYLTQNSSFNVKSTQDISLALLSTRVLPLELVLPLFGILAAFFVFSKKYTGRFFALPAFLLSMWLFVPLILTQGYLFGFYIDYNRFLYFIILPVMIFIAVLFDHGSGFFARIIDTYRTLTSQVQKTKKTANKRVAWLSAHLTRKAVYSIFILGFLLFSFVTLPIFMTPGLNVGETIQSFYQVMDTPGWQAIQWAKNNTPAGSVFVSDALYGWWFSGFAQRPTLSAVDPQYLSLDREFNSTQFARNLLDTDYLVDNGLIQVREDGGYLARHNPEFLAKINGTYFPYPFFNFDNDNIEVTLRNDTNVEVVRLSSVPVTDMHMESTSNDRSIYVTHGNELFNFTQKIEVFSDSPFANMTETVQTNNPAVSFDTLKFDLDTKGDVPVQGENNMFYAFVDTGMKEVGELIFPVNQLNPRPLSEKDTSPFDITFTLNSKTSVEFSYYMGVYPLSDNELTQINDKITTYLDLITGKTQTYLNNLQNISIENATVFNQVFDYRQAMAYYNVSYLAVRDFEQVPRFTKDPLFSLVFINSEVAIFKVKG